MMTWYYTASESIFLVTAENCEQARQQLKLNFNLDVPATELINVKTSSRWTKKISPYENLKQNLETLNATHPMVRP